MVGGVESYRDEPESISIRMESRFKDKYLEYKNNLGRKLMADNIIKGNLLQRYRIFDLSRKHHKSYFEKGNKGVTRHFNATNRHQVMGRFFQEVTCQSATLYQMKENLWRAAHAQRSLQADNIQIPNAAQESIPEEKPALEVTFYESCLRNYNLKPESDDYFCRCFDNTTRHVMEGNERDNYSANFSRFFSDVDEKELTPEDPLWRLQLPLKYCKAQALDMHMDDAERSRAKELSIRKERLAEEFKKIRQGQEPQHIKDDRKAKQEAEQEEIRIRNAHKAKQEAAQEEQRLEKERKATAKKSAQKKNEEYNVAWQALIEKRAEKLSTLDREYREKVGAPPRRNRNGNNYISTEERKAEALAYAEARKNKKPIVMSREERKAEALAYSEARRKVEAEYQEAKAKLLKDKQ